MSTASNVTAGTSFAERLRVQAGAPERAIGFDADPETAAHVGATPTPRSTDRGEAYDAVSTDDLGAEWLARATEALPRDTSPPQGELDELTTLEDLFDEDPASRPTLELEPDSKPKSDAVLESEALLGARIPAHHEAQSGRPRVPPAVFDIADITQEEDAPRASRQNT